MILNKWSDNNLPDEYELTGPLDTLELDKQKVENDKRTMQLIFGWYILPLLLVLGLDILIIRRSERKRKNRNKNLINPLTNNKMRKNIVAGNWKMNKTLQEGIAFG